MEKLSIKQASERFGLSRARLYQLLESGTVVGERSQKKGRNASSWIDAESLDEHIKYRYRNHGHKKGGPKIIAQGNYIPVSEAAKKTGYTQRHIHFLVVQGSIGSREPPQGRGRLVHYDDLLNYKNNYGYNLINQP